jgi:N6-adenosine-specific RNA methylase IME4
MLEEAMATRGRPRKHADARTRWRDNKRRQRHPTVHLVQASLAPGEYVLRPEDLVAQGRRFGCIMADPPWPYEDDPPNVDMRKHYPPMSLDAICALPVRDLALPQSHLHMWVTAAFLFEAAQVFDAWGFTLMSHLAWGKTTVDGKQLCMGGGHYWRGSHEICLLGVRGNRTASQKHLRSLCRAPRGIHSEKPDRAWDLIEQLSPRPRLELFRRTAVPRWMVWGNQRVPTNGRLCQERIGSRRSAAPCNARLCGQRGRPPQPSLAESVYNCYTV